MSNVDQATLTMLNNLARNSGKTLAEWVALTLATGAAKHGEMLKWLKGEQGLTHGYANLIALSARDPALLAKLTAAQGAAPADGAAAPAAVESDLVAAQYGGDRAALKPIHDALIAAIAEFGSDVELAPKKTYVSLRRSKQFGLIQPSTKTRLDVGIQLKGVAPDPRLEASGSFNAMVSHRVKLSTLAEVDAELIGWLRQAYEQA
jgi:predicted transport protein